MKANIRDYLYDLEKEDDFQDKTWKEITQGRYWHMIYTLKLETLKSYEKIKLKNDGYTDI